MNKSNLAHKQGGSNDIQLHPSTAKKLELQAMSEKFDKGYVMSSRLYRQEVRPFLTSAAKDIYAELEDHINGYKDKVTDHVSYSQLQGGKLPGAKKLSTATVRKGLKELLDLGVISLVSENSRKGNEYRINEVSLVEHFSNESTTLETKALQKLKRQHFSNESASTLETKDTIELLYRITSIELLINTLRVDKPLEAHFFVFQQKQKQIEVERKTKEAEERKERTRKLPYDEVIQLTENNIQKICNPELWAEYVTNRSQYKKSCLTKNALKAIFDDFKAWGKDKADASLKTAIKGNHQGLFEPRMPVQSNSFQNSKPSRMQELEALRNQGEEEWLI